MPNKSLTGDMSLCDMAVLRNATFCNRLRSTVESPRVIMQPHRSLIPCNVINVSGHVHTDLCNPTHYVHVLMCSESICVDMQVSLYCDLQSPFPLVGVLLHF